MIRSVKRTRNSDDVKVLLIGVVLGIIILVSPVVANSLQEQRWYRDVSGSTPFRGATTDYTSVDDGSIAVGGFLIKRRCTFLGLSGYIVDRTGIRHPVHVDTSPEVALTGVEYGGSRPPSDDLESWGPWVLTQTSNISEPTGWEIYVDHGECPSPPVNQTNLFTSGAWVDYQFQEAS